MYIMASADDKKLLQEYESVKNSAENFCNALVEQINKLLFKENISLAIPVESRVKSWDSIRKKLQRSGLELKSILQLNDLVGIRLILPFKRDLDKCLQLVDENFTIIYKEDTAERLGESQFGYQFYHYILKLPESWLSTQTLKDFDKFSAEIQIRTLAQHIWAVSSHKLQYKQEENVPPAIRRSINRVSALLETVDLEFERVLSEREQYVEKLEPETADELLNVDLLRQILDDYLPFENLDFHREEYSELLQNLLKCGIKKSSQLISLINEQKENALEEDAKEVIRLLNLAPGEQKDEEDYDISRAERGAFFTHTSLVRIMLTYKFGGRWKVIDVTDSVKVEVVNKKPNKNKKDKSSNQ